jgi:hypothetical protein
MTNTHFFELLFLLGCVPKIKFGGAGFLLDIQKKYEIEEILD